MPEMGTEKIVSKPPPECKKVVNIYVDKDGKVIIEYETED